MKRIFPLMLILMSSLIITACNTPEPKDSESTSPSASTTSSANLTTTNIPPEEIAIVPSEYLEIDDDFDFVRTKRLLYYRLSWPFDNLAEDKAIEEMFEYVGNTTGTGPPEMVLVSYVKYCNIPRVEFDKALAQAREWSAKIGDDLTLEEFELPNADIIYTFDNEIINAYYRRENPVVPDWTKTTVYESYAEYLAANP